ncbi:MAG: hypothetical protein OSA88_11835 [Acidimicrobiales bacterium]|nr:hypothetical protein [Acidimicrobiales bacterium]
MTKPGGRMPPGERGTEGQRSGCRRRVRRVVATERREGAVTRNEESGKGGQAQFP